MRNPSGRDAGHAVPGFLSPFRLSAFASWVILCPLGKFSLPRGRPTGGRPAGPQRGCRVAHEQDPTGQGALLTPGTVVRSRPTTILRPAPAASLRPIPIPRWNIPSAGVTFTRRHQGFTHVRPSPPGGWLPPQGRKRLRFRRSSPRLPPPNGTAAASASTPGFAPRGYPQSTPRRRQAIAHWPEYYTFDISRTSKRCLPLHSCTLRSHVVASGLHHRTRDSLRN
jgi:hypothetical protein